MGYSERNRGCVGLRLGWVESENPTQTPWGFSFCLIVRKWFQIENLENLVAHDPRRDNMEFVLPEGFRFWASLIP
jgi:hypothetical protein